MRISCCALGALAKFKQSSVRKLFSTGQKPFGSTCTLLICPAKYINLLKHTIYTLETLKYNTKITIYHLNYIFFFFFQINNYRILLKNISYS